MVLKNYLIQHIYFRQCSIKTLRTIITTCTKMLENSIVASKGQNFLGVGKLATLNKITTIIGIFHQTLAETSKFIDSPCHLVLKTKKSLMIEPSCPYRKPLFKSLLQYSNETINLFLSDSNIVNQQYNRFMIHLLKPKDGIHLRNAMQHDKPDRLAPLVHCNNQQINPFVNEQTEYEAPH